MCQICRYEYVLLKFGGFFIIHPRVDVFAQRHEEQQYPASNSIPSRRGALQKQLAARLANARVVKGEKQR